MFKQQKYGSTISILWEEEQIKTKQNRTNTTTKNQL